MHAPPIPVGWSTARRRKLIPSQHRGTDLTTTAPLPSTPLRLRPRPELFLSRPTCPAVRLGRALRKRINALQALDRSCSPRCRSLLVWVRGRSPRMPPDRPRRRAHQKNARGGSFARADPTAFPRSLPQSSKANRPSNAFAPPYGHASRLRTLFRAPSHYDGLDCCKNTSIPCAPPPGSTSGA